MQPQIPEMQLFHTRKEQKHFFGLLIVIFRMKLILSA